MAAARIAWPLVANGLPASIPPSTRTAIAHASNAARAIVVPPLMGKPQARSLTGPAAGIAGLFQPFSGLTERGWALTGAAADEISSGTPAAPASRGKTWRCTSTASTTATSTRL